MHVATTRTTIQIVHGLSTKSNVFHPVQESNVIVQDCSQVFKQLNNHFFDCHKFIVNFTKSVIGCSNFDNCSYTFFSYTCFQLGNGKLKMICTLYIHTVTVGMASHLKNQPLLIILKYLPFSKKKNIYIIL